MMLYLIRHAKTKEAEDGIHQNDNVGVIRDLIDPNLFSDLKPEKVYSSPLQRAKETAEILFGEYEVLEFLYEFKAPSILRGKPREFGHKFWEKHLPEIRKNPDWKYHGDGESFNDIVARIRKFLNFVKNQPYQRIAVIGHGTFFRHTLGVLKFGNDYNFEKYEKFIGPIKWENLELKEVKIIK